MTGRPLNAMAAAVHATLHGEPFISPSRNPVTRTGRISMRGSFYSQKNLGFVKFESDLERKVFYLLEFVPSALQFSQQPPRMQLRVNGKSIRYTPDVAVKWRHGQPWLIEVKPLEEAHRPEWLVRFAAAAEGASEMGFRYVVVTDRHVNRPGMRNVVAWVDERRRQRTELLGGGQAQAYGDPAREVSASAHERLDAALASRGHIRVSDARSLLGGGTTGAAWLDALLSSRRVVAPMSESLTETTFIHSYTEADDAELFA